MSAKSALVIGATGATGKHVLRELLLSPHFDRVGEYGRRVTEKEKLQGLDSQKLVQKVIDFEKLKEDNQGLKEGKWDVVFVTLGTTRAQAGSAEAFEKIDREYVVNAARAAKVDDPAVKQRVVYLSSAGANATSSFLYPKSKGLTEIGLASLGYSDTIIFRPGFLASAERGHKNIGEAIAAPIVNVLSYFTSALQIDVAVLAKGIVNAGNLGSGALPKQAGAYKAGPEDAQFTVIGNKGALELGKSE